PTRGPAATLVVPVSKQFGVATSGLGCAVRAKACLCGTVLLTCSLPPSGGPVRSAQRMLTTYQGESWMLDSPDDVAQVRRGSNIQLLPFPLVTPALLRLQP